MLIYRTGAILKVAAVALASSACGSSAVTTARTAQPRDEVTVPGGWKTYNYGKAKVSVPESWQVATHEGCTDGSAPGLLVLGVPDVLVRCPVIVNTVYLLPLSSGTRDLLAVCPPVKVNGLQVYVGPCGSRNASGLVSYSVPALGIEAVGTGTSGEDVTGTATTTVVGQVLHTLR
jgi:hypothetical protein